MIIWICTNKPSPQKCSCWVLAAPCSPQTIVRTEQGGPGRVCFPHKHRTLVTHHIPTTNPNCHTHTVRCSHLHHATPFSQPLHRLPAVGGRLHARHCLVHQPSPKPCGGYVPDAFPLARAGHTCGGRPVDVLVAHPRRLQPVPHAAVRGLKVLKPAAGCGAVCGRRAAWRVAWCNVCAACGVAHGLVRVL